MKNEVLAKELGTTHIYLYHKTNELYYYKNRPMDDKYTNFGEQDRRLPVRALIVQGQMNLTRLNR